MRPPRTSLVLALFLLSCGVLLLEIAMTRILSVLLLYHYTFAVVSSAVLGLGLGGLLVHRQHWTALPLSDNLERLGLLTAIASFSTLGAVLLFQGGLPIPFAGVYLPLAVLPFVPIGIALALTFASFAPYSGRLYAADLVGAGTGALLAVPTLNRIGGMGAALLATVSIGGGAVAFAYSSSHRAIRRAAVLAGLLPAVLLVSHLLSGGFDLRVEGVLLKEISAATHAGGEPGRPVYSRWDAFARTDVLEYPDSPDHMAIFLDGGSASPMHRFPRTSEEEARLRAVLGYLPLRMGPSRRVLTIGPGGGEDVLLALLAGSEQITAVEISSGAVEAVRRFGSYNGHLYDRPEVTVVVNEGRSFLRRSQERYDLIYLSKAVTQVAERAGYALAESYLYTVEAFGDYLDHLHPDGRLAIILHDERDMTRAFTTALSALVNQGMSPAEASRQLVLINDRAPERGTIWYPLLLLKNSPFTQAELDQLFAEAALGGFEPLFVPGIHEEMPLSLLSQHNVSLAAFVPRLAGVDATPTADDRPFFYALRPGIPSTLSILIVASLALLATTLHRQERLHRAEAGESRTAFGLCFAALGVGFMAAEVAVIQRFSLFLGYPTLSLTVTLATLLLAGGIGGWLSQRVREARLPVILAGAALAASLLLIGHIRLVPWLTDRFLAVALSARVALTVAMVAPLGLVMGVPFPLGLRWLRAASGGDSVAWVWAVNGLASVLGSSAAVAIAMWGGFSWSQLLASVIYLGLFAGVALSAGPVGASVPLKSITAPLAGASSGEATS